jgi:hypothetical protein
MPLMRPVKQQSTKTKQKKGDKMPSGMTIATDIRADGEDKRLT